MLKVQHQQSRLNGWNALPEGALGLLLFCTSLSLSRARVHGIAFEGGLFGGAFPYRVFAIGRCWCWHFCCRFASHMTRQSHACYRIERFDTHVHTPIFVAATDPPKRAEAGSNGRSERYPTAGAGSLRQGRRQEALRYRPKVQGYAVTGADLFRSIASFPPRLLTPTERSFKALF